MTSGDVPGKLSPRDGHQSWERQSQATEDDCQIRWPLLDLPLHYPPMFCPPRECAISVTVFRDMAFRAFFYS